MTRKQALLALLGTPAGLHAQRFSQDTSLSFKQTMTLEIQLQDARPLGLADVSFVGGGMDSLVIRYRGQEKKFTAKELWEALNQP